MKTKMMTAIVALGCMCALTANATTNITDFSAYGSGIIDYKENGVQAPTDGSAVFTKTDWEQINLGTDDYTQAVYVETPEVVVFESNDINVNGDIENTGTLTFRNKDNTVNGNTQNAGTMTFDGTTGMNGNITNSGTMTFQNGDSAINGGVTNTGTISFQNGIENFDNTDWSSSAGTGTVNFDSNAGIRIGTNTRGKTLVEADTVTGNVNFVIDNGVVDENGLDVSIDANQNSLHVNDNPLYNIQENSGAYTVTQKDENGISEQGYTSEQAALLKTMMGTSGNAFFDNITTLVQMGQSANVASALDHLRPATAAAQYAAVETTVSTIRAIYNHIVPAHDEEILAGMRERNHITPWVEGLYTHTRNDMDKQGFAMHQAGIALGIDTFVGSNTLLGIGYSQTSGRFDADIGGKTDLDGYTGFVYGAWKPSQFFISAMASYSKMKYDNNGVKWDADVYGGQGTVGYEWGWIDAGVGARYIRIDSDSYKNAYGVDVHTKNTDIVTGLAGVHVQHVFKEDHGWRLVPSAHLALTYDIKQGDDQAGVSYAGQKLYTYRGEKMKRFGTEAGASLKLTNGPMELSATYEGAFRKKQYTNGVYATLKYHF
ncbi:MAG: autotransporter domain-containing protein [Alphaproteobacteria bacterium]|nr:autotransporter domain-containing protein [Alphaproteobacteria bacterium]